MVINENQDLINEIMAKNKIDWRDTKWNY